MSFYDSLILVQDRQDNYHLVDYYGKFSGIKWTLCNKKYTKKSIINTLALDTIIDSICPFCQKAYQENFSCQVLGTRNFKGNLLENLCHNYESSLNSDTYRDIVYKELSNREWQVFKFYKRKVNIDQRK